MFSLGGATNLLSAAAAPFPFPPERWRSLTLTTFCLDTRSLPGECGVVTDCPLISDPDSFFLTFHGGKCRAFTK